MEKPVYAPKLRKWIVDCGEHLRYFEDGETAEDFYLMNKARARKNETKNS